MAGLPRVALWHPEIYQLELTDKVKAGPDGVDNLQAKQLGDCTQFLKEGHEALVADEAAHYADVLERATALQEEYGTVYWSSGAVAVSGAAPSPLFTLGGAGSSWEALLDVTLADKVNHDMWVFRVHITFSPSTSKAVLIGKTAATDMAITFVADGLYQTRMRAQHSSGDRTVIVRNHLLAYM